MVLLDAIFKFLIDFLSFKDRFKCLASPLPDPVGRIASEEFVLINAIPTSFTDPSPPTAHTKRHGQVSHGIGCCAAPVREEMIKIYLHQAAAPHLLLHLQAHQQASHWVQSERERERGSISTSSMLQCICSSNCMHRH
jgi:hypothetical protein